MVSSIDVRTESASSRIRIILIFAIRNDDHTFLQVAETMSLVSHTFLSVTEHK